MPKVRIYSVKDKRYREFHWHCNPSPEYCRDCSLNNQCDKEPDDKEVKGGSMSLYVETLEAENESLRTQLRKMKEEARKKVDIDKACSLIESMAGNYLGLIHEKGLCASTFHTAEFVKDFRKAMEDEK